MTLPTAVTGAVNWDWQVGQATVIFAVGLAAAAGRGAGLGCDDLVDADDAAGCAAPPGACNTLEHFGQRICLPRALSGTFSFV
jgi:hypothetical protein